MDRKPTTFPAPCDIVACLNRAVEVDQPGFFIVALGDTAPEHHLDRERLRPVLLQGTEHFVAG